MRTREQLCRTAREEVGSHGTGRISNSDQLSERAPFFQSETTLQLRERWKASTGPSPAGASRDFMTRAVRYRMQEHARRCSRPSGRPKRP
jgi:hypothetical protein